MARTSGSIWTTERTEQVARLWSEAMSASAIAAYVSAEWRVTVSRNAIIGKAHREQWHTRRAIITMPRPPRAPSGPRPRQHVRAVNFYPHVVPPPSPKIDLSVPPTTLNLSILELSFISCRFPLGDPRTPWFRFCGATRREGALDKYYPYCPHHDYLAHQHKQEANHGAPEESKVKVSVFACR